MELIGRAMTQFAFVPAHLGARALQRPYPALQRLRAAGAERYVTKPGCMRAGEFQRVALVVIPGSEINGVALPAALGHAKHIDEEAQAFFGSRREHLKMSEMGHIHDRFIVHGVLSPCEPRPAPSRASFACQGVATEVPARRPRRYVSPFPLERRRAWPKARVRLNACGPRRMPRRSSRPREGLSYRLFRR